MDNNKKKVGIIIFLLALIFLGVWIYIFYFRNPKTPSLIPAGKTATSTTLDESGKDILFEEAKKEATPKVFTFDVKKEDVREWSAEDLRKFAASFAERFGSFSNQANYENVTLAKNFMSQAFSKWADDYVAEKTKEKYSGSYYGMTTTALVSEVKQYDKDAGQAQVMVKTTRRENNDSAGTSKDFNQDILISLIKENGEWKIDNAEWQK